MTRPRIARIAAAGGILLLGAALAACQTPAAPAEEGDGYVTEGKLTIGTGEPAYFPYVIDDDPESGDGFESAVAYAVAAELGFDAEDVVWVRSTFEAAIAPGPKDFDINLQQFTISEDRAQNVDFSSPYYSTPQAVVTVEGSAVAGASSIDDLKDAVLGAQVGTTSLQTIETVIEPSQAAQPYNSNDDAVLALQNGQVDALVVDLPTAFYMSGVQLEGGVLIGQLPADAGISDEWGLVLAKDSPLTEEVTAAVDALTEDGTLAEIAEAQLGADAGAPLLQ
ncbi:ABC transporter substrate-binding protein [Homoserinibacter sp. YIM 151385]|uniref:ABC transporter substrate-binding protein n=1 Tax=Homoserinibacter sp. YIM 151385 TaxID=2985506 RepID=UPI0022F0927D|nr:transporter substrate-binding domain-containing protein [Homoserinibacter sp. YIM 151385]WBU38237.1 transporter substrate-binding domain-containing protein [Homoserinibacter sp. YIM 151385]